MGLSKERGPRRRNRHIARDIPTIWPRTGPCNIPWRLPLGVPTGYACHTAVILSEAEYEERVRVGLNMNDGVRVSLNVSLSTYESAYK